MGHGSYSIGTRLTRSKTEGFDTKSSREIFKERSINNVMDPAGINMRESRDSIDHPNSIPIILALDVTGSMGSIPHFLVKEGLPLMMDGIIKRGVLDPQILFLGIGDHECDRAPLQVGQFESNDELLDHWLTKIFIESGGGGNFGESYLLAWYFASKHTQTDHFEKRNRKGLLFTIGDEPTLKTISKTAQKNIMGTGQYDNITAVELLDAARENYEVFHLHLMQGHNGKRQDVQDDWRQIMGDNLILIDKKEDVAQTIINQTIQVISSQGELPAPIELMELPTPAEME